MTKATATIAACAALVGIASCTSARKGHGSSPSPTPSTSASTGAVTLPTSSGPAIPTSSVSATSTATQWTKATALTEYKAMDATLAAALKALEALPSTGTLSDGTKALAAYAKGLSTLVDGLASGAWPTADRAAVNDYIASVLAERNLMVSLSHASSLTDLQSHSGPVTAALAATATTKARLETKLGV